MSEERKMSLDDLVERARAHVCSDNYFEKWIEKHSPNSDNSCKSDGCSGEVVKQLRGWGSGCGYVYDIPSCNSCGRFYINTKNPRVVGLQEFHDSLNKTFDI